MFDPWVAKTPWSRKWQPTTVFLPGKFHDRGAWRATVHGVAKSQTRLSAHNCFILCVTFCYETWISHMDTHIPFLLSLPPNPKTHPSRSSQQSLVNQIQQGIWLSFICGWESGKRGRQGYKSLCVCAYLCFSYHTSNCILPTWSLSLACGKYKMQAVKCNFWVSACHKTAQLHKQSWLGQHQPCTQTIYLDRIRADTQSVVREQLLLKRLYLAIKDSPS